MPALILQGIVSKVGFMNKTATVTVPRWFTHPRTKKRLERHKKYLTHDPNNELRMADEVTIKNVPPISARKRFALYRVLRSPEREREERHRREAEAAKAAMTNAAAAGASTSTQQSAHA